MSLINSFYLRDETGVPYGVKHVNNKPRVSSMPYLYDIAEGNVAGHAPWAKIGYTPTMTTADSDIWSGAGVYVPPTAEMGMEVVSGDNTADRSTAIFSGTATGGTTTTLIDTGKNFTAGTPVAVGDTVVLEKAGASPEWGVVTAVTSATTLTLAGGFTEGGSASGRTYDILDKSAFAGAQAVQISYLDDAFAAKREIVLMNGTGVVATTNTDMYRVNAFRIIAAGVNGRNTGTIDLRNTADTPIYSRITAGYTRGRNSFYTVPAGKTLYITQFTAAYGFASNSTHYCRIYTRATQYVDSAGDIFRTPGIFYPYTEVIVANNSQMVQLDVPTRLVAGVDIKVSGIATFSGIATVALRGWLE